MKALQREDIVPLRASLARLGAVVAEVDLELRYAWIDNPHPDFDVRAVVGRRDDELLPSTQAAEIMMLKREALSTEEPVTRILRFKRSDRIHYYSISAYPIFAHPVELEGLFTVGFDSLMPFGEQMEPKGNAAA